MNYRTPFGPIETDDHNWPDALCLSRTHCANAVEDTITEFHQAAVAAIEHRAPQPAFFLARQLAELCLKALHGTDFPITHRLTGLLESLRQRGDQLVADGSKECLVVSFIRDLDHYDGGGDQGRYPTTRSGTPSLALVCCADPVLLREHVDRLYSYTLCRLAARNSVAADAPLLDPTT